MKQKTKVVTYDKSYLKYIPSYKGSEMCIYTKSTNISVSGFKVTLANSLLSYTTHSDSIFLENLPFHIRSDKGELKMEVFYDKFTDDDPFKQDQNKLDFFFWLFCQSKRPGYFCVITFSVLQLHGC
jgi:hypothetical protein